MAEVYRLYTESHYDATTKTIGAGQSAAFDAISALGGARGDVRVTLDTTSGVKLEKVFAQIGANVLRVRVYYDFSSLSFPENVNIEFFSLFSSTSYLSRIGILLNSGVYYMRVGQYSDGRTSSSFNNYAAASRGPDYLEMYYIRPTSSISSNGSVQYSTGASGVIGTQTGIDNYDEFPAINKMWLGAGLVNGGVNDAFNGTYYLGKLLITNDANPIGPILLTDPSINILTLDAGNDLTNWSAVEGASKGTSSVTFTQESSGAPGRVEYQFSAGRFALNTAHRFTGLITPTILNYPHTDVRWFVRNDTTGLTKYHQMTLDGHSDNGGQSEIGEPKPFNIVFYSTSLTDRFTIGFENVANGQQGCSFSVSNLGVYIVL